MIKRAFSSVRSLATSTRSSRARSWSNTDDEHDPERVTIAFERAQVFALLRSTRQRLDALEAALRQFADGSYGACNGCGEPIGAERLAALPGIGTCIACAARTPNR